jgi:hypothetical protein
MQVPSAWQKALWKQEHIKVVPDKQRILKWNIVPGDIVRRAPNRFRPSDKPETYEVLSIDKWQNKVYLRGTKVYSFPLKFKSIEWLKIFYLAR